MLSHLKRKNRPRVFLNSIKVIPKSDLTFVEKWVFNEFENLDVRLRARLAELLALPHISSVSEPRDDDLAIDIVVPKYATGSWGHANLGKIGLPMFLRPKLTIASRLFEAGTDQTVATFAVDQKMPWLYYFRRIFRLDSWLGSDSGFKSEDFEYMLIPGLMKLIDQMRKSI